MSEAATPSFPSYNFSEYRRKSCGRVLILVMTACGNFAFNLNLYNYFQRGVKLIDHVLNKSRILQAIIILNAVDDVLYSSQTCPISTKCQVS